MKDFSAWIPAIVVIWTIIAVIWLWMKIGKSGRQFFGLLIITLAVLLFFMIESFTSFNQKTLVATVTATEATNEPHMMAITLKRADNSQTETYELGGDLWSLQASVIEYSPWLNVIGLKNGFALNRLDSEYSDPNHQNAKPILLNGGGSLFYQSIQYMMYNPFIKSAYGSAVVDPADGRAYNVYCDTTGDVSAQVA